MKRAYHHCDLWEEIPMWQKVMDSEKETILPNAVKFTGNHELYGFWMLKVIDLWPISSEQNLSHKSINRQAWIGHAACYLAIQCPEDITREAWWLLTEDQREKANAVADIAITEFERRYTEKIIGTI
jgi:hypothetical protein